MRTKMGPKRLVRASVSGTWCPNTCTRIVHVPRLCLDVDGLYDMIGADPSMSCDQIRSAAKERLMECHPDRGGDAEEFIEVHRAYEVLCDEDSRAEYDSRRNRSGKEPSVSVAVAPSPIRAGHCDRPAFWKEADSVMSERDIDLVYRWIDLLVETAIEFRAELDVEAGACRYPSGYSIREEKAMIEIGTEPERWAARIFILREMSKRK